MRAGLGGGGVRGLFAPVHRYRVRGASKRGKYRLSVAASQKQKGQLKMVQAVFLTSTMQPMQTEFHRHMLLCVGQVYAISRRLAGGSHTRHKAFGW